MHVNESKFRLSRPKQIVNLRDLLPSDGEDDFCIHYSNQSLDLNLLVSSGEASIENKILIRFDRAKTFFKTPFPGVSIFSCPEDREISILDSIVAYEESEMLRQIYGEEGIQKYRHYRVFLHSSGVAIYVIASNVEVILQS